MLPTDTTSDGAVEKLLAAAAVDDPTIKRVLRDWRHSPEETEASPLDIKRAVYVADLVLVADLAGQTSYVRRHPDGTVFWRVDVVDGEVVDSRPFGHAGVQGLIASERTSLAPLAETDIFERAHRPGLKGGER